MLKWISLFVLLLMASIIAKDVKIGYIDSDQIYQNYQETVSAKNALDKEVAKFRKSAESLKTRADSAESEYESQKLMLSEVGRATKFSEIEQLRNEYNSYVEAVWGKGGKIEMKNRELLTPIVTKINEAVNKIAKEEGYTMVLDAADAKIVYADVGLDLTDMVLEELNKEYKPIAPTTAIKQFLVFPFYEANTEAQQDNLGQTARTTLVALLQTQPKVEIISKNSISDAMRSRNLIEGTKIDDNNIYGIGRELLADFIISGSVSKQGKRISLELTIYDPKQQIALDTEKGESSQAVDIRSAFSTMLPNLIKKTEIGGSQEEKKKETGGPEK
jgi:outer membrane protein